VSTIKIADIVVAIPYGNEGKKRWRNVGALLQHSDNDPSKGPGFTISLDAIFNPAGAPSRDGQVMLSCFHPNDSPQRATPVGTTPYHNSYPRPKPPPQPDFPDDDIPF